MAEPPEIAGSASVPPPPLGDVAELVLQQLRRGILVFDSRLQVIYHNKAAEALFGVVETAADLARVGSARAEPLDLAANVETVLESGQTIRRDGLVFVTERDGERLLDVVGLPLAAAEGQGVLGAILAVEDVTHRAGLERRVAVSERLAAVGKLSARVAHELNNPLDGILRYINLAIRVLDSGASDKVVGYLEESRKGLMRMAQIISELLEFSRSSAAGFDETNINDTVDEAVRALQEQADRAGVIVAAVYRDEKMPSLRGTMLFQVCCNLIKNAIDAMPETGRLTITTAVVDRDVVLRFEDTGVGLPDDVGAIFEPFFTTKLPGKGTGLGLAICKDYVERLHGRITAERREPQGAIFTLYIPLASCVPDSGRKK